MFKGDCIFCGIAAGKIPAEIVAETGDFIVIKDINPAAPIHLLVISKEHHDSLLDNGDGIRGGGLFELLASLAKAMGVEDSGFRTVINTGDDGGQTVGHLHIHFLAGRPLGWPPG